MNIFEVRTCDTSQAIYASTVGTAVSRSFVGKCQKSVGISIYLVKKNVTKEEWQAYRDSSIVPNQKMEAKE